MFCIRSILIILLLGGLIACVPGGQSVKEKQAQQADVHYKLGVSHLQANNPTLALKELLIAVENGPQNPSIHASLAQAYQLKKAFPQAEQHYLQAIQLSDSDPRYQNNLASLYIDMQQWDKAIAYFDKAAANLLFMSPHIALTGKGYAYFKKQDYPAAIQQLDEVIAIAPRYAQAYYYKSETYKAMGKQELARLTMEKAVDVAPGFVQAIYQLGVMSLQDNQTAAAQSRFERVVELAPTSEWGMQAAEMLRALKKAPETTD
jgi:Tfp pilus assembly protein PilF